MASISEQDGFRRKALWDLAGNGDLKAKRNCMTRGLRVVGIEPETCKVTFPNLEKAGVEAEMSVGALTIVTLQVYNGGRLARRGAGCHARRPDACGFHAALKARTTCPGRKMPPATAGGTPAVTSPKQLLMI
jgi:hypothetical protein